MKRIPLVLGTVLCAVSMYAQPKLTADNVEDVLKAMTLEEKATLCVGQGWGQQIAGLTGGRPLKIRKAQTFEVSDAFVL